MSPSAADEGRPPLFSLTVDELSERLNGPGRARRVYRAAAEGLDPFDGGVPAGLQARLSTVARPHALRTDRATVARDDTTKLLVRLEDGQAVETVVIPEPCHDGAQRRATLCVSSQVGCARGCRFCATGTMGLRRNLTVDEIVGQVVLGRETARQRGWHLRNLVFMGMGEPLDNAAAVGSALDILTDHRAFAFAPKHVTISTVGPRLSAIERLADWPGRLAWSLHAARPQIRARLVPPPHPDVRALTEAFARVCGPRRPLFVEMTLMDGVNDADEDMAAAAALFRDFPAEVRFNLIAMNPGPTPADLTPSRRVEACQKHLLADGYLCFVRQPRGVDEAAACGQLAVLGAGASTR